MPKIILESWEDIDEVIQANFIIDKKKYTYKMYPRDMDKLMYLLDHKFLGKAINFLRKEAKLIKPEKKGGE